MAYGEEGHAAKVVVGGRRVDVCGGEEKVRLGGGSCNVGRVMGRGGASENGSSSCGKLGES